MCEGVLFVLLGSPDQIGFFVDVGKEGRKEKGGTASTPRMLKSETYTLLHGKKDTHKRISKKKISKLLTPSYAHTKFGKDFLFI